LIDQALKIKKKGQQREIPVYSKIFSDSPELATRFRVKGLSDDFSLGDIVDRSLGVNYEDAALPTFSSGFNNESIPRYDRWINPTKHDKIFTFYETASLGTRVIATRLSIVVSEPDLTKPEHSSAFFYRNLQGAI
jgi:hypothetical protein